MTTLASRTDHHDEFDSAVPGHLCWIVEDESTYIPTARQMLRRGASAGAKPVAFAPAASSVLELLAADADITADPRQAFLGGGPLVPDTMFRMFREQTELARSEGHQRLCLVADMDWLLPLDPAAEEVVAFELALDRVVAELDATVVCAYRTRSFGPDHVMGALAVHPDEIGSDEPAPFRFVASNDGWRLIGEVDVAGTSTFRAALAAGAEDEPCTIDVRDLEFIDCAGLRQLAEVCRERTGSVILDGASPLLCRLWGVTGFASAAPSVVLRPS